jgi:hypothetical protein
MVAGLRGAAPAARIVLGGALASREADAAALCGADATALSAREFEAAAASPLRHARERVAP